MSGSQKGSWIQTKVNMYVIISEQLSPAHSWTRSLLELHVHHCLGEPHHLLFPRLRGFPLLIATWRSRMVCLSLSAGIPGLELPEHEGLILSPHVQPLFRLFSSLLFSNHAQCLVHQYKLNISHFLLDCISFELRLPFVVLHQLNKLALSSSPFTLD